jgi:outer membrane receptor protein involved in Fe transport
LDGAAHLNVSLFRTDFSDLQVSGFDGIAFVVGNAAEATTQGIELDGMWRLTERLTLGGSYSYLDAQYGRYENAPCTAAQKAVSVGSCQQDISGQSLHYAPENSANVNLNYVMSLGDDYELELGADVNYSDDVFLQSDLDPEDSQEAFSKVNARIALDNLAQDWSVALIAKNITDERTTNNGVDVPILEGGAHVKNVMPPRTVALQLNMRF